MNRPRSRCRFNYVNQHRLEGRLANRKIYHNRSPCVPGTNLNLSPELPDPFAHSLNSNPRLSRPGYMKTSSWNSFSLVAHL